MPEFVYAVRCTTDEANGTETIDLWVSEDGGCPIPDGSTSVTLAEYCDAWREKTGQRCAAIAARQGQSNETRNG